MWRLHLYICALQPLAYTKRHRKLLDMLLVMCVVGWFSFYSFVAVSQNFSLSKACNDILTMGYTEGFFSLSSRFFFVLIVTITNCDMPEFLEEGFFDVSSECSEFWWATFFLDSNKSMGKIEIATCAACKKRSIFHKADLFPSNTDWQFIFSAFIFCCLGWVCNLFYVVPITVLQRQPIAGWKIIFLQECAKLQQGFFMGQ